MKLSLCITHYNENWEICKPLFDSLALQQGISWDDVEVIVANDGKANPLTLEMLKGYPFSARVLDLEHKGVCHARNIAMKESTGDYLMLCDCDDMFISIFGLHLVFSAMQEGYELITSSFVEESIDEKVGYKLFRHDKDITFIHGKAYKKSFLVENNLCFCEDLTIHEDGYFETLVAVCADMQKNIENPFYLWKWNNESTVRKERSDNFLMKTYGHLLESRKRVCEQLYERGFISEYYDGIVKTVFDFYYDCQKPEYLDPQNAEYVKKAKLAFKRFYKKFGNDYKECNISRLAEIATMSRTNAFSKGMRIEQQTITQFLNEIVSMENY